MTDPIINPSSQFSSVTRELDRIAFENSQRGQKAILSYQKTIQEQTDVQVQALNRQGYVYLTAAAVGILCLTGAIIGAALNTAAQPPAAEAQPGTMTFQRIPTPIPPSSTLFAKITETARDALKKSHERLPDLARTIEHGSQMVTNRFKNPETRANARIREEEIRIQQTRENNAHMRSAAEEIERLRNSIANNEAASMRVGG